MGCRPGGTRGASRWALEAAARPRSASSSAGPAGQCHQPQGGAVLPGLLAAVCAWPAQGAISTQLGPLGLVFTAQAALLFGCSATSPGHVGAWLARRPEVGPWLDRLAGTLFIGLGLALLSRPKGPQPYKTLDGTRTITALSGDGGQDGELLPRCRGAGSPTVSPFLLVPYCREERVGRRTPGAPPRAVSPLASSDEAARRVDELASQHRADRGLGWTQRGRAPPAGRGHGLAVGNGPRLARKMSIQRLGDVARPDAAG